MERRPRDSLHSGIAKAMVWATRCSSVAMQFAVPPAAGLWLDHRYQTKPIGVCVGAVIGFAVGFRELLRLVRQMDSQSQR